MAVASLKRFLPQGWILRCGVRLVEKRMKERDGRKEEK